LNAAASDRALSFRISNIKIGWHTFRHTYSTMLRSLGVDMKVQQELLRQADIQTTMTSIPKAVLGAKREANSKVMRMVYRQQSKQKGRFWRPRA
jgi:integrase